jgi:hypothetical protein
MSEMTAADKISIVLKEYEALRKEIDARTDATKNYGWPVIAVAFAAIVGWKAENIDFNIAVLLAPVIAMTIYALAANANYSIDKAREGLALVEDRIFEISKPQVLICYESLKLKDWKGDAEQWLRVGLLAPIVYISFELYFFSLLPKDSWSKVKSYPAAVCLLLGVLIAPLAIYSINTFRRYRIRSHAPCTELMNSCDFKKIYEIYKSCHEVHRQR